MTRDGLELLMFCLHLVHAGIIGMLYHFWGYHFKIFFSESCLLKIKSVKSIHKLFESEVKCKL